MRPPENPETEITGPLFQRLLSTGKSGYPIRKRVDMTAPGNLAHAEEIEAAQTDAEVLRMVSILGADPLVRWKDSVEDVMIKTGCESKK